MQPRPPGFAQEQEALGTRLLFMVTALAEIVFKIIVSARLPQELWEF